MNKLGKITIKHYLEKKGNHIIFNREKKGFPIYCQVTYNRKTTKFRSFTLCVMTEIGFKDYQTKNIINLTESYTPNLDLKKEIILLELSIKDIIKKSKELNVLEKSFLKEIKIYFEPVRNRLIKIGWFFFCNIDLSERKETKKTYTINELKNRKNTKEENRILKLYNSEINNAKYFYNSFNQKNTLLQNIDIVNKVLKTDIKPYFYNGSIMYWEIVEIIIKYYRDVTTIEFLQNFDIQNLYIEIEKTNLKFEKEDFNYICNELLNRLIHNF